MTEHPWRVLFLCTGNSARSLLGEALLNHLGRGRFAAFSAGSHPAGAPNPLALEVLAAHGVDTRGLRSKSWDEFAGPQTPAMDMIFTVCDQAAREACPIWPGHPLMVPWGIPDPAAVKGSLEQRRAAFEEAFAILHQRIQALVSLPPQTFSQPDQKARLRALAAT